MSADARPTRDFPLADVLTVTTPFMLSRELVPGLRALLEWMTGQQLPHLWQLPRAADEAAPELIRQHPFLHGLRPAGDKPSTAQLQRWLDQVERRHPGRVVVRPLTSWTPQHPIAELCDRAELVRLPETFERNPHR